MERRLRTLLPIQQAAVMAGDRTNLASPPTDLQPPVQGRISSVFGARRSRSRHQGVDIAAPKGTPIEAAGAGQVVFSGWSQGYGNTVLIKHQDGLFTRYAHADHLLVSAGDTVQTGQQVATVGSTGHTTGPHLHFEVLQNGRRVNPLHAITDNPGKKAASIKLASNIER
jgi:murein DD-endopeptidase MepM/ murein hydrolase activator NlpD